MIKIITGNINSGKTTFVLEAAQALGLAGVVSLKTFRNDEHTGYDALDLATGKTFILARKMEIEMLEGPYIGDYSFSRQTFDILTEKYSSFNGCMVIDEIGPLELRDSGFSQLLNNIMLKGNPDTDLVLVIRNRSLYACIEKWSLKPSIIVQL